jgi:hypothetical protein
VLEDAIDRLHGLDRDLDGRAVTCALAYDLGGDPGRLAARTDPAVSALAVELVDLVVRPRDLTRAGRPSAAAGRRATRCRASFAEGYLVGRIGLDTHRLPLHWSAPADLTIEVTGGRTALRTLALHPALAAAYGRTRALAPLLADLADETRGVPADLAAQFSGFGLLAAVAEWTVVVGGAGSRALPALLHC